MSAQPEDIRFPFPPSPVPYDPGPEIRELMGKCPVNKVRLPDDSTAYARMELQESFRGLLTRLPGLRLTVPMSELEFREGQVIDSMRQLPVTWDDTWDDA